MKSFLVTLSIMCSLAYSEAALAGSYSFGYRLDFQTGKLSADQINPNFPEFKSGHTSAFFFRKYFGNSVYVETAPGAWNSEEGNSQFTFQYNTIGAGVQLGDDYLVELGANVGAGLFVLSNGAEPLNQLQTSATLLRKDSMLYTLNAGIGRRWNEWSVLLNVRYFGFVDDDLSHLNNLGAGLSVGFML